MNNLKEGRYNKVFFGALIYFIYFVGMSIVKKLYMLEITPSVLGLWWIHLIIGTLVLYIYLRDSSIIPLRQ